MAFCTSCGKDIPASSPFCEHCGARQELPVSVGAKMPSSPPPAPDAAVGFIGAAEPCNNIPAEPRPPRKPMSKGMKIGLIAAGSVAALLFLFVFIMGQLFTPEKTAAQFLEAVRASDYAAFSKIAAPKTDALELTEESVAPFFLLYSDDTYRMSDLQDALEQDILTLKNGVTAKGDGFVRLIQHDYFLFKTYSVELTGTTLNITSPMDNTRVDLGVAATTVSTAESSATLANLFPGKYEVSATAKSPLDGSDFNTSNTLTIFPGSNNRLELYFDSCQLSIQQPDLPISGIFINDAAYTGEVLFDYNELSLSPLHPGDTVRVEFDVNGVEMSDSYQILNSYDAFYPKPNLPEEVRKDALEAARVFFLKYIKALNDEDLTTLEALSQTSGNLISGNYNSLERSLTTRAEGGYYYISSYTITDLQGDLALERASSDKYDLYYRTTLFCKYDKITDEYFSYGEELPPTDEEPYNDHTESSDSSCYDVYLGCGADGKWTVERLDSDAWGSLSDLSEAVPLSY